MCKTTKGIDLIKTKLNIIKGSVQEQEDSKAKGWSPVPVVNTPSSAENISLLLPAWVWPLCG